MIDGPTDCWSRLVGVVSAALRARGVINVRGPTAARVIRVIGVIGVIGVTGVTGFIFHLGHLDRGSIGGLLLCARKKSPSTFIRG